jgi:two-component system, NtrC family, nitrogen regulation response regulator NtrX
MQRILIVEDEKPISSILSNILQEEIEDAEIQIANNGLEAFKILEKEDFDLVISDIKMPHMSGTELLQKALAIKHSTFVMMSGHADIESAVGCIKDGAFDFIQKPLDINRLMTSVKNALAVKHLKQENNQLKQENTSLKKRISKKHQIIGEAPALAEIQAMIAKVAPTDARVLITGPNGAGKELVAHALHQNSQRCKGPMVEVNCAAIPAELIESELFGHTKGSFTGAVKDKSGKFEQAQQGTIFLDEIGDMSLSAQAKVLRALQESRISPVGSDKEIKVDVRVLAATNKDLKEEIAKGRFREDLFHRLSVIEIKVPALDDRKSDIPLLVAHFAQMIAKDQGMPAKKFSAEAIESLQAFGWTGNIRELRNVVERLLILGSNPVNAQDVSNFVKK